MGGVAASRGVEACLLSHQLAIRGRDDGNPRAVWRGVVWEVRPCPVGASQAPGETEVALWHSGDPKHARKLRTHRRDLSSPI